VLSKSEQQENLREWMLIAKREFQVMLIVRSW
jgi:hypothetical protein